jgi:hypothetical protein
MKSPLTGLLATALLGLMQGAGAQSPAPTDTTEPGLLNPRHDLRGMWEPTRFFVLMTEAPMNEVAQARIEQSQAANAAGRIVHTAWTTCRPGAISSMTMAREPIMIMQTPRETVLLYEMPRMARRVQMNVPHPERLEPGYLGYSVGRWEGDTLVIESTGFNGYAEMDARGMPTSDQLQTVERLTKSADGETIEIEVTITDPVFYSEPFTINRSWRRVENRHQHEYDCQENPRQEDFEHAHYIHDLYRPTCMRVAGQGTELSRMICRHVEQQR